MPAPGRANLELFVGCYGTNKSHDGCRPLSVFFARARRPPSSGLGEILGTCAVQVQVPTCCANWRFAACVQPAFSV